MPLELRVCFRASAWRWKLDPSDAVEIWQENTLLGSISGASIRLLIEYHLGLANLQGAITREMNDSLREEKPPVPREVRQRLATARRARPRKSPAPA